MTSLGTSTTPFTSLFQTVKPVSSKLPFNLLIWWTLNIVKWLGQCLTPYIILPFLVAWWCSYSNLKALILCFLFFTVWFSFKETAQQSCSWKDLWSPHLWSCWSWHRKFQVHGVIFLWQETRSTSWVKTLHYFYWGCLWECWRVKTFEGSSARSLPGRGTYSVQFFKF